MKGHSEAAMEILPIRKYPLKPEDYKLYEEVGTGASASVHRALCISLNEIVAIKIMDLDRFSTDLDTIRREVQTMTLLDHPNLLKAHCSFVSGTNLWIVTPYMDSGSCVYIMKYVHPNGFQQSVIATLLFGVLKALAYLHSEGLIHRDVKAGNVLVDSKGSVKLADFGVSASLFDSGNRRHARNTFIGTPCWMAPEVMQPSRGYDFKADIWSFGITALELAHGHAPFSNYPPMKVLLMTIQNAPPSLDCRRDKKFSRSFKNLVSTCLVKEPKKRPTAEKLLKHRFFKYAQSKGYLVQTILKDLPPLGDRYRMIKEKEANLLAQNKENLDQDKISQTEYIRGISAWDFDPEKLKIQAALLGDDSDDDNIIIPIMDYHDSISKDETDSSVVQEKLMERSDPSDSGNSMKSMKCGDLESLSASFPNKAFQGPEGDVTSPLRSDGSISRSGENAPGEVSFSAKAQLTEKSDCSPKIIPNGLARECSGISANSSSVAAVTMLPSLLYLLDQNIKQMELIMQCIKDIGQCNEPVSDAKQNQILEASAREKALESHLVTIQQCTDKLAKELETHRKESAELEMKVMAMMSEGERY